MNRLSKTQVSAMVTLLILLSVSERSAHGQAPSSPSRVVDLHTCYFVDGGDMAALLPVIERWNDWADQAGVTSYTAFLMTPYRHSTEADFDVGWIGVWPSGEAMGWGEALWLADGEDLRAEFAAVVDCTAKRHFAALTIGPQVAVPPDTSFFGLRNCLLDEGRALSEGMDALTEWAEHLSKNGHQGFHWMLFRLGGRNLAADYTFKWLHGFGSPVSYGQFVDFNNDDGVIRDDEHLGSAMHCDNRRLYLMNLVRMAVDQDASKQLI